MKQNHPRIHLIEVEYARAMTRAGLSWIRQLIDDIRTGAPPRADHDDPAEETDR